MVAVRCSKKPKPILSQKCVRSSEIDVVPLGVKTAVSRTCAGVFTRLRCAKAAKNSAKPADLNPRPHCMLSALVGALLSEVAYGPGMHWVEERTAKTSRSGSAVPARWSRIMVVPGSRHPEPLGQLDINSSIDKYFPFNPRTDERFGVDSFDFLQKSVTPL